MGWHYSQALPTHEFYSSRYKYAFTQTHANGSPLMAEKVSKDIGEHRVWVLLVLLDLMFSLSCLIETILLPV